MSNKTKNDTTAKITEATKQAGLVLMAAAATLGLAEVPHDPEKRAIVPHQPALALAPEGVHETFESNEIRRERDEVHPHYHGYGVNQRTPARSGRA